MYRKLLYTPTYLYGRGPVGERGAGQRGAQNVLCRGEYAVDVDAGLDPELGEAGGEHFGWRVASAECAESCVDLARAALYGEDAVGYTEGKILVAAEADLRGRAEIRDRRGYPGLPRRQGSSRLYVFDVGPSIRYGTRGGYRSAAKACVTCLPALAVQGPCGDDDERGRYG